MNNLQHTFPFFHLAYCLSSPGWTLTKLPSFTLIGIGSMRSLIKSIFFSRDCSHQLGSFFSGPSIELNFSGKRNSSLWVTKCQRAELEGRGFKNTFYKPGYACVCLRRLASVTQSTCDTYAELFSVCKTLKGHDFDL